jgi:hypothetical protein
VVSDTHTHVCIYIYTHTHTHTHTHTYIHARELAAHLLVPVDGVTAVLVTDTLGLGLEVLNRLGIPPLGALAGPVKLAALIIKALCQ